MIMTSYGRKKLHDETKNIAALVLNYNSKNNSTEKNSLLKTAASVYKQNKYQEVHESKQINKNKINHLISFRVSATEDIFPNIHPK